MKHRHPYCLALALATVIGALPTLSPCRADAGVETSPRRGESCITCHSDPDFLVTHPKLYEYYRDWEGSIHGQQEVTCSDCHGGDPEASDASQAHSEFGGGGETNGATPRTPLSLPPHASGRNMAARARGREDVFVALRSCLG